MTGSAYVPAMPAHDPAFLLGTERGLRLSAASLRQVDPRDVSRSLAMRVARHPLDLRAHAQRIHLLVDLKDPDRLFGAVVDLFLALGGKGADLREAMLEAARPVLDPDDHGYLRNHLSDGLHRASLLPVMKGTVLSRGAMGTFELVIRERDDEREASYDPFDDPFYIPPGVDPT